MSHPDWDSPQDLAAAYALGALEPDEARRFEAFLAGSPEAQREVITLFYLEAQSIEEVAQQLDLPEGTVKSHLHRARRALGAIMKE